jgi:hypothetical protein
MTDLRAAQLEVEAVGADTTPAAGAAQALVEAVGADTTPAAGAAQALVEAVAADRLPAMGTVQMLVEMIGWVGAIPAPPRRRAFSAIFYPQPGKKQ